VGVPLAVGAGLMAVHLTAPWTGSFDANGARYSIAARNYLRYGLAATRGGQVLNAGELQPDDFRFYSHHPPGISLTLAASFALLGAHEWSARLVFILFTLAAAACLHRVAQEMAAPIAGNGRPLAGVLAAIVFLVQPMVALYGRIPDHEAPAAFFALALAVLYLHWQRTEDRKWLLAMSAAAFIGAWYAWIVCVVPWLLLAYHWLVKRRGAAWMLLPAAAAAVGFLAVLGHVALVEGGLGGLWGALAHRWSTQARDRGGDSTFGLWQFLARQGWYFWAVFSGLAGALSLGWVLGVGRPGKAHTLLVAALAIFGLSNVVVFYQGAFIHVYYQFYLAIPLALMAGLAIAGICRRAGPLWGPLVAACLVLAIAAEGLLKLAPVWREQRGGFTFYPGQMEMAAYLRETTEPQDRVLLRCNWPYSFCQLTYYADRNITVVADGQEAHTRWQEGRFTKAFGVSRIRGWEIGPLFESSWKPRSGPVPRLGLGSGP
jgi:4-amino-4-deoxy-L-arabinose transferase-like glycosyltransferase